MISVSSSLSCAVPFGFCFFIDAWFLLSDVSRPVSFAGEAVAKLIMGVPQLFRWVTFLVTKEALGVSHLR